MIEKGLLPFLLADANLTLLVGDRVYPNRAPEGADWPRVLVHRISTVPVKCNEGRVNLTSARVQVESWGQTYKDAKDVTAAIKNAHGPNGVAGPKLDGFKGYMGNVKVQSCFVEDERDDYTAPAFGDDVGAHRSMLDLMIWFEEN